VQLRRYRVGDLPAILALFRDTVRRISGGDYSLDQLAVWAPEELDVARWARELASRFCVVAEENGRLLGFADLDPAGRLDRLYVNADWQSRGVGGRLLEAAVAEAKQRGLKELHTEASLTAQGFFTRRGFRSLGTQTITLRGVALTNVRMVRQLE